MYINIPKSLDKLIIIESQYNMNDNIDTIILFIFT